MHSRVRIFIFSYFFLFLRVYPASTPASSSPAFEKKFFFSFFFLIWEDNDYLTSLVIFLKKIITKVKLLQGWSLICLFLDLNLNVNLNVELNLNLNLRKAPLGDIGTLGISSTYII